ncbi:MAG: ABC transporter permease [candidate division KSB1 bacterium]|nr:ABC transporter permease [candidate division KSB1 bacterium]
MWQPLQEYGILLAFLLEFVFFSLVSAHFLTLDNLINVTLQTSIIAIIAVGMTFVILTAGIDLSVGSLVALSGMVAAWILKFNLPSAVGLPLAIAGGLTVGMISGAIAGFFVTYFRVTPFIVTLALMTVWRGLAYSWVDGRPIWGLPESFDVLGSGRLAGIPFPSLVMVAVYVFAFVVLKHTPFGRNVYAVGGNAEAARLAGIPTSKILMTVYLVCGVLASLSGVLLASRMSSGQPNAGLMYELDVIAAVVVGGASLFGGRGSITGTFIGAMLIGVLRNGLNLTGVGSYVQQIVLGLVILFAVLLDQLKQRETRWA